MALPPSTKNLAELEKWVLADCRVRLEGLVVDGTMSQEEVDAKYERLAEGMREGGLQHALALGTTRPAAEEVQLLQILARGEQSREEGDLPTTAKPADHKEEAERPCSPGRQWSVINVILDGTGKNGGRQATTCVQREPGGADPLGLSVYNEEGAPSSDSKEEPQTKVEDAMLDSLNPGSSGRAARRAEQQTARR